jgi:hypothetical protein
MEFSKEEERMISWLRRQHENWRSTRAIILIVSVGLIGLSGLLWWQGETPWHYLLLFVIAVYGLSYTLGSWSGRPEISLLLKLIEERREK